MAGIYIICFILFPAIVFMNMQKASLKNEFMGRQESDVVKGIATCFVILAHLTSYLNDSGGGYNIFLYIFTVMGGMGVLLFFFLSGYGLYKGYVGKTLDKIFWKNRLINMYLPCVIIQLIFYLIKIYTNHTFNISNLVAEIFLGAWFIDVILIQYIIFFVTWKCAKGKPQLWIVLNFSISVVVALIFWKLEFNARWYNGLMLFPFGMLIAYTERKIIVLINNKWSLWFVLSIVLFVASGTLFTYLKGELIGISIAKTFSGMCLCLMICIFFLRINLCSRIMQYIGKRSLYFYLVHLNLLTLLSAMVEMKSVYVFYEVLIMTFLIVELFYWGMRKCKICLMYSWIEKE